MPQCMDKYKEKFAFEFAKVMQKNGQRWRTSQKTRVKNLYTKWVLIYIGGFFAGFIPVKNEGMNYNLNFHIVLSIIGFIGAIFAAIFYEIYKLKEELKTDLYTNLLKAFGHDIVYDCGEISYSEYNNSQLFDKPIRHISVDNRFCGIFKDSPFVITEANLNYIKTSHGETQETRLFKGISMYFKMQKKVKSRVLIYSKSGFNKTPKGFEKVEFEYNKFNQKYDVYVQKSKDETSGQIEARYLFNTAFMDRFMQLQTSFKIGEIKCSIFEDTMLVLLATNRDLFEINPLFKKIDDINNYQTLFDEFASVLSFLEVLNLSSKTGL